MRPIVLSLIVAVVALPAGAQWNSNGPYAGYGGPNNGGALQRTNNGPYAGYGARPNVGSTPKSGTQPNSGPYAGYGAPSNGANSGPALNRGAFGLPASSSPPATRGLQANPGPSGFQALYAAAQAAESKGNYLAAFNYYNQGTGMASGNRVRCSAEEMNYCRQAASEAYPKAVIQLNKTNNRTALVDLMREAEELFVRCAHADPQNGSYHLNLGGILTHLRNDYNRAGEEYAKALKCTNLNAQARAYCQQELVASKQRAVEQAKAIAAAKAHADRIVATPMTKKQLSDLASELSRLDSYEASRHAPSRAEQFARDQGDQAAADRIRNGTRIESDYRYDSY